MTNLTPEEIEREIATERSELQRTIEILCRHPLQTSARKARLYTWREAMRFIGRTVVGGGRTLRSAKGCFAWYDGRR
mgnify:CR=1 FL=1